MNSVKFFSIQGLNVGPKNKALTIGSASLNLAEFASATEEKEFELSIPLAVPGTAVEQQPSLCVSSNTLCLILAIFRLISLRSCPFTNSFIFEIFMLLDVSQTFGHSTLCRLDLAYLR